VLELLRNIVPFEAIIRGFIKNALVAENENDFAVKIILLFLLIDSVIVDSDNHTASTPNHLVHR
jgi:hypothetical protein